MSDGARAIACVKASIRCLHADGALCSAFPKRRHLLATQSFDLSRRERRIALNAAVVATHALSLSLQLLYGFQNRITAFEVVVCGELDRDVGHDRASQIIGIA